MPDHLKTRLEPTFGPPRSHNAPAEPTRLAPAPVDERLPTLPRRGVSLMTVAFVVLLATTVLFAAAAFVMPDRVAGVIGLTRADQNAPAATVQPVLRSAVTPAPQPEPPPVQAAEPAAPLSESTVGEAPAPKEAPPSPVETAEPVSPAKPSLLTAPPGAAESPQAPVDTASVSSPPPAAEPAPAPTTAAVARPHPIVHPHPIAHRAPSADAGQVARPHRIELRPAAPEQAPAPRLESRDQGPPVDASQLPPIQGPAAPPPASNGMW